MLEGNSMKIWCNCFQLNSEPPVIFRTKTKSQVRGWINAIEDVDSGASVSSPLSGYCWQKPHDTKVWCSFVNNVFSVSSNPGGQVLQSWTISRLQSPRAAVYTRDVTLSAANNWQSTAVYKLQVGFHGMQQFVCKVIASRPEGVKAKAWRSPFFVVKSCNRHAAAKLAGATSTSGGNGGRTPSPGKISSPAGSPRSTTSARSGSRRTKNGGSSRSLNQRGNKSKNTKAEKDGNGNGAGTSKVHTLAAVAAAAAAAGSSIHMLSGLAGRMTEKMKANHRHASETHAPLNSGYGHGQPHNLTNGLNGNTHLHTKVNGDGNGNAHHIIVDPNKPSGNGFLNQPSLMRGSVGFDSRGRAPPHHSPHNAAISTSAYPGSPHHTATAGLAQTLSVGMGRGEVANPSQSNSRYAWNPTSSGGGGGLSGGFEATNQAYAHSYLSNATTPRPSSQSAISFGFERTHRFVANGAITLSAEETQIAAEVHASLYARCERLTAAGLVRGCNILAQFPDLENILSAPMIQNALGTLLGQSFEMVEAKSCHTAPAGRPSVLFQQNHLMRRARSCSQRIRHVVMLYFPQVMTQFNAPLEVVEGSQLCGVLGPEDDRSLLHWHTLNCEMSGSPKTHESSRHFIAPENFPTGWGNRRVYGGLSEGTVVLLHPDTWHRYHANSTNANRHAFEFHFLRVEEPMLSSSDRSAYAGVTDITQSVTIYDDRNRKSDQPPQMDQSSQSGPTVTAGSAATTSAADSAARLRSNSGSPTWARTAGVVADPSSGEQRSVLRRPCLETITKNALSWIQLAPSAQRLGVGTPAAQLNVGFGIPCSDRKGQDLPRLGSGDSDNDPDENGELRRKRTSAGMSATTVAPRAEVSADCPPASKRVKKDSCPPDRTATGNILNVDGKVNISIQELVRLMGWSTAMWGTPQGVNASEAEPLAISAAFLLSMEWEQNLGARTLLHQLDTRLMPIASISPAQVSIQNHPPNGQQSLATSLSIRNVQSTIRRHSVDALACCTYVRPN